MKYILIKKTPEYLIINKPAGLLVHPSLKKESEETLVDQVIADFPEIAKIGEDPLRPGLMHRLDRLVSGLMIIARTQGSFDNLKLQFQKRTIKKYYTALVFGKIEADSGRIDFLIKRGAKGNKMAASAKTFNSRPARTGRVAITDFSVLKRYINFTLLSVKLKTGRTHQIRCHFSAYGAPVAGDELYGSKKSKAKNQKIGLNRIFLHAGELEFKNLQGEIKNYKIDLPEELKRCLENKIK
ncbi:MAG: RNA pseudouridine synthase [Patescibacteria group bacterium]|nr:RNA pseudouridine synthase [Patescibacteria group bacterium]